MILIQKPKKGRGGQRCDARCYNSPHRTTRCRCICGGANHGVGLKAAVETTQQSKVKLAEEGIQLAPAAEQPLLL